MPTREVAELEVAAAKNKAAARCQQAAKGTSSPLPNISA